MGDESSEAVSRQVLQHALQEARPRVDVIQKTLQLKEMALFDAARQGNVEEVERLLINYVSSQI